MLFYHALTAIVAIATAANGIDVNGPKNVLPLHACNRHYGTFSSKDMNDKRICHGQQGGPEGDEEEYDGTYRTTIFSTKELYEKSTNRTWINNQLVDFSGSQACYRDCDDPYGCTKCVHIFNDLLRVETDLNEYLLTSAESIIYAILNIKVTANYSWKRNITDGFNINPSVTYGSRNNPTIKSLHRLPSSSSEDISDVVNLAVGTDQSTIELIGDLNLESGSFARRGQLYFNSSFCQRRQERVYARDVSVIGISSKWLAASSTNADRCGISIYSRTVVDAALSGDSPQVASLVIWNEHLAGPVYSIVALRNGNLAVAASDSGYQKCILTVYDMTDLDGPILLNNITFIEAPCSSSGYELEDGSVAQGISKLTGYSLNKPSYATYVISEDRVFVWPAYHGGSETNSFFPLKDNEGAITRFAAGSDNMVDIFDTKNRYCKSLFTGGFQAKSLQQLSDGSLAVGTNNGTIALYPAESVQASCDSYAVPDITLSGTDGDDSSRKYPVTLEDGAIMVVGNDLLNLRIFNAIDIRDAMEKPGNILLEPSFILSLTAPVQSVPQPIGSGYALVVLQDSVCMMQLSQYSTCEYVEAPLLPDGQGLNKVSFASIDNTSFVALQPGGSYDSSYPRDPNIVYCDYYPEPFGCIEPVMKNANFTMQRYDYNLDDKKWMLNDLINGTTFRAGSVVALWYNCVVVHLDNELNEIYFINMDTNSVNPVSLPLKFESSITIIEVIEENTLTVSAGSNVYMLSDSDIGECGVGATLDSAKGFDALGERSDTIKKLHDDSYAIAVELERGFRTLYIYEDEPTLMPFLKPSYSVNPNFKSAQAVDIIDEIAYPTAGQHNLVIHGSLVSGVIFPEHQDPTPLPTSKPATSPPTPGATKRKKSKVGKSKKASGEKRK